MPTWPTADLFPQTALNGWTETPGNNTIRTQNDTGPSKVRRLSTSAPTNFSLSFILNETQANSLMNFYETSTTHGSVKFDGFPHPRTDSGSSIWRFLNPPALALVSKDIYRATIKLELLP